MTESRVLVVDPMTNDGIGVCGPCSISRSVVGALYADYGSHFTVREVAGDMVK